MKNSEITKVLQRIYGLHKTEITKDDLAFTFRQKVIVNSLSSTFITINRLLS